MRKNLPTAEYFKVCKRPVDSAIFAEVVKFSATDCSKVSVAIINLIDDYFKIKLL